MLPEAAANAHSFEHEINVGYTSVLSPHLVNQLRFLVGKADNASCGKVLCKGRPERPVGSKPLGLHGAFFIGLCARHGVPSMSFVNG